MPPAFAAAAAAPPRARAPRRARCPTKCQAAPDGLAGEDVLAGASRVGAGTWSWGNQVLFGYDAGRDGDLQAAFEAAVVRGVSLFDTADSYGSFLLSGRAETLLGRFLRASPVDARGVVVASKVAAYPWRLTRGRVSDAVAGSAARLGRPVDLLQLHWSTARYLPAQDRALWDGAADALRRGDCRAIGVSNFGPKRFRAARRYLAECHGVRIAAAQAQLSLLSRAPLTSGLAEEVRAAGASLIGYSPLCLGLLAGGPRRDRGALRNALFDRFLDGAQPLQQALAEVAGRRGVPQARVAVAWALAHADFVLTGVRTAQHAEDAATSAELTLTGDEMQLLERAGDRCPRQMVQNSFQTR